MRDEMHRRRFFDLVAGTGLAASEKNVWAGWRNVGRGVISDYGRLLAEEQFAKIVELTDKL